MTLYVENVLQQFSNDIFDIPQRIIYNTNVFNSNLTTMNVELKEPELATRAATWCKRNKIDYKLEFWGWPVATRYKFFFNNDEDMMLFSLKWL